MSFIQVQVQHLSLRVVWIRPMTGTWHYFPAFFSLDNQRNVSCKNGISCKFLADTNSSCKNLADKNKPCKNLAKFLQEKRKCRDLRGIFSGKYSSIFTLNSFKKISWYHSKDFLRFTSKQFFVRSIIGGQQIFLL